MVTQLQPDVRAYLHGGEVIKRYIRVEEVAHEYGFSVEETEYIAKAASSLYKLTACRALRLSAEQDRECNPCFLNCPDSAVAATAETSEL